MATTLTQMLEAAHAAVPKISPAAAADLVANGNAVIVDIRDGTEVAASGKAKGAITIPRGSLESRSCPTSATHHKEMQHDRPIVLYCAGGNRAALAGKTLLELGYKDVRNLGGFKDWVAGGGAVEK